MCSKDTKYVCVNTSARSAFNEDVEDFVQRDVVEHDVIAEALGEAEVCRRKDCKGTKIKIN